MPLSPIDRETLTAALNWYEHTSEDYKARADAIRKQLGRPVGAEPKARRKLSAAARKRIAAAQKKRWAAYNASKAPK